MHTCTCYTCERVTKAKGGPDFLGFLSARKFRMYEKLLEQWISKMVQDAALKVATNQVTSLTQLIAVVEKEILNAIGNPPPQIVELLEEQSVAGLRIGAGKLPVAFPRDMILESVPELVKRHTLALRNLGSNAAKQAFAQLMESSVRAGDSIDDTTEKIMGWAKDYKQVKKMTEWRARTIARTESARAMMDGQVEAWKQTGRVEQVEWLVAPNSCQYCQVMDKKKYNKRSIGTPFLKAGSVLTGAEGGRMKIDYGDVFGPPLHPNCRCDLLPVIK